METAPAPHRAWVSSESGLRPNVAASARSEGHSAIGVVRALRMSCYPQKRTAKDGPAEVAKPSRSCVAVADRRGRGEPGEVESATETARCITHPASRHPCRVCRATPTHFLTGKGGSVRKCVVLREHAAQPGVPRPSSGQARGTVRGRAHPGRDAGSALLRRAPEPRRSPASRALSLRTQPHR